MSEKIIIASEQAAKNADITIGEAGLVAIQGMLIVFAVLIVLMLVLNVMKLLGKEEKKEVSKPSVVSTQPAQTVVNKDETVAVISSAVAYMSGDDPNKRLRVVSITDAATGECIWKK